jgi:hypothetical protein
VFFPINGTERVPELLNMEKAYNYLFLQAHYPPWYADSKNKEDDLNPKGNTREACKFSILWNVTFFICGTIHVFVLWNDHFFYFVE